MTDAEAEAFVPTLAKARAAKASVRARVWWRRSGIDLLAKEPTSVRKLAAILTLVTRPRPDEPAEVLLRYPYVPEMPFALEEGTARLFERHEEDPPECLRVELERRGSGDPYRGMPTGVPDFRGFQYGHALEQAQARILGLRSGFPGEVLEVRTFAWPILRLSYRALTLRRELGLLVRPDGVMHAMVCRGRWM